MIPVLIAASVFLVVVNPQYVLDPRNPTDVNTPRHKLYPILEKKLNDQVAAELSASVQYMAMSSHFAHDKINRPGFAKFFKKCSEEEFQHAMKFVEYLSKRGALLSSMKISLPQDFPFEWNNGLHALNHSLNLEGGVTDKLSNIHNSASEKKDGHLTNFLEHEFLDEQIESMRLLSGYISNLKAMSHEGEDNAHKKHDSLAEYLFDVQLQKKED